MLSETYVKSITNVDAPRPSESISNDLLQLMSKMTCLVCVCVLTTHVLGLGLAPFYPGFSFAIDSVINSTCVALMNAYNDPYYQYWCCPCDTSVNNICITNLVALTLFA